MTYLEEINKLRRLLQITAYPSRGTAQDHYDRYEIAALIHAECELEDVEPLKPDTYYAHGRYATEDAAKEDLATCAYAGKWKSAKTYIVEHKPDLTGPAYWDAVRLHFLELGGEWLSQISRPAAVGVAPAFVYSRTGLTDYREPQKVRQG